MTLDVWTAQHVVLFTVIVIIVSVWSAVWKAIALWKSAKKNNLAWFIVFCVVNLVGILEILYIFVFSKHHEKPNEKPVKKKKK